MPRAFKLPDLGEGIHEGEILAVHVSPGQHVNEGDIILEVETDKAAVEIPSPFSGTVLEVLVHSGDIVKVGAELLIMADEKGETAAGPLREPRTEAETSEKKEPVPASPATRRLARELGVDLHQVTPTGSGGVVTADDVKALAARAEPEAREKAAAEPPSAEAAGPVPAGLVGPVEIEVPDFAQWGPVETVPFRSVRRATARRMATAWSRIPHVNSQDSVDVTRLEAFRQKHKAEIEAAGGRLTLTIFALKAVATALKTFPRFNASLDEARETIIIKKYYHIGVAMNTEHGLVVPVIRDVDRKSIKELALELHELLKQTHSRKISREALRGGTFTITNAGAMGGGFFTPIINHPEVAILGLGQARMQPAVVTDRRGGMQLAPRLILPMVLCIDHRVLDGADAIRFMRLVGNALEDPDELLISMV